MLCLKNFDPAISSKTVITISEPKTKSSIRNIPLSDKITGELQVALQEQQRTGNQTSTGWNEQSFVFITSVGSYVEPRRMQKFFK